MCVYMINTIYAKESRALNPTFTVNIRLFAFFLTHKAVVVAILFDISQRDIVRCSLLMCICFLLPLLFHMFVLLPLSSSILSLSRRLEHIEYGWCKMWIGKKRAHVLVYLFRQNGKVYVSHDCFFAFCSILFVIHPQTHWHNKITRLKPNQVLLWLVIQFFNFAHEITAVWHLLYMSHGALLACFPKT